MEYGVWNSYTTKLILKIRSTEHHIQILRSTNRFITEFPCPLLSTMESLTTPNPISKARVNSKPYDEEKGHLYIIITWGKKRSKQKHFSFYAKDLKIPHFNTIFPPDYNWESETFKLPNKKVTSHYFAFGGPAQKYFKSMCDEFPKVQKEIECCYDGLFLKVE